MKNWTLISRVLGLGLGLEAQVLVNITVYGAPIATIKNTGALQMSQSIKM